MDTPIFVTIISALVSVVVAAGTFLLTKKKERESEWRKEKLVYYKDFIESLSGVTGGDATDEGQRLFARSTNNLLLFAPQSVIEAMNAFRNEISASNPDRTHAKHDELLANLLLAIRKDIGVSPADDASSFKPYLWESGVSKRRMG